jgi:hypothetical protein
MNQNAQTFTMPQVNSFVCQLAGASANIGINSLSIFNSSNGAVSVYLGAQTVTSLPDFIVPANASIAYPTNGSVYITLAFGGTSGSVYAQWSDQSVVSVSSAIPVVPPSVTSFFGQTDSPSFGTLGAGYITGEQWGVIRLLFEPVSSTRTVNFYINECTVGKMPPYVKVLIAVANVLSGPVTSFQGPNLGYFGPDTSITFPNPVNIPVPANFGLVAFFYNVEPQYTFSEPFPYDATISGYYE